MRCRFKCAVFLSVVLFALLQTIIIPKLPLFLHLNCYLLSIMCVMKLSQKTIEQIK